MMGLKNRSASSTFRDTKFIEDLVTSIFKLKVNLNWFLDFKFLVLMYEAGAHHTIYFYIIPAIFAC